jgi:hypothetical protein
MTKSSSFLVLALLATEPGCALINGLEGDDDDDCSGYERQENNGQSIVDGQCFDGRDNDCNGQTDCNDPDCFAIPGCDGGGECNVDENVGVPPFERSYNVCEDGHSISGSSCDGYAGPGVRIAFHVEYPGEYEVCAEYQPNETRVAFEWDCYGGGLQCVGSTGCVRVTLDSRDYYVVPRAGGSGCGNVWLSVRPWSEGETACLDGLDDDGNGLTDCEDEACRGAGVCNVDGFAESCNGVDDDGDGWIDDWGCFCVNRAGCDDMPTPGGLGYICHTRQTLAPPGACFVDCVKYQSTYGMDPCMPSLRCGPDGQCEPAAVPPPGGADGGPP